MTKHARRAIGSGRERTDASARHGHFALRPAGLALAAALVAGLVASPLVAQPRPPIELVSRTSRGQSAEGRSDAPAASADARFVAFNSNASNILSPPLDVQRAAVYVRDRAQGTAQLASIGFDGSAPNSNSQANGFSSGISADGRFISFSSNATNLVPDDANAFEDVFVYDRIDGVTELISRGIDGPANGASSFAKISGDGRYVVFQSQATNLVEGDDNAVSDVFLFDRQDQVMRRVSIASDGTPANGASITPNISADGRIVAFASQATNLVAQSTGGIIQIFAHDWQAGTTELVSASSAGDPGNRISFLPALTADGSEVGFKSEAFNLVPGDTNGVPDVFIRTRPTGATQRVSVDSFGNESNGLSAAPGLSADGRFVAFASFASSFDPEDGNGFSDVFVYDRFPPGRAQGLISRVTIGLGGSEPNNGVPDFPVSVSADGRFIAFASAASNLVPDDVNNDFDVFVACNPFEPTGCTAPPPTPTPTPTSGVVPCVGDCDGNGVVTIDDLIRMVAIALGLRDVCGEDGMGQCLAGDADCDCEITVDEIIRAVNNSLNGCTDFGDCTLEQHAALCCEGPPPATPTPTATRTPTSPGFPCDDDEDCPPGQVCVDHQCVTATPTSGPAGPCVGDCDGDSEVTIDELIRMVNIALDLQDVCGCLAGDADCDCEITVDEIIRAVNNSLNGCTEFGACSLAEHESICCEL